MQGDQVKKLIDDTGMLFYIDPTHLTHVGDSWSLPYFQKALDLWMGALKLQQILH